MLNLLTLLLLALLRACFLLSSFCFCSLVLVSFVVEILPATGFRPIIFRFCMVSHFLYVDDGVIFGLSDVYCYRSIGLSFLCILNMLDRLASNIHINTNKYANEAEPCAARPPEGIAIFRDQFYVRGYDTMHILVLSHTPNMLDGLVSSMNTPSFVHTCLLQYVSYAPRLVSNTNMNITSFYLP